MSKSSGYAVVAILLFLGIAAALSNLVRPSPGTSVVLVTIDTLRADRLGCYGYGPAKTPALDSLAAEGALFEDVSAASPVTLPSHVTILTGLLPPRHGMRDNDTPFPLPPAAKRTWRTAAELFREGGFETAAFVSGSPLSARWGLDAGFDTWDQPPDPEPGSLHLGERPGGETLGKVLGWLGRRDRKRPFFLWVHLFDPHHPYAAPGGGGHPSDSSEAYDEEVAYADRQVGRLLDALRESGDLRRTVLAVCADHGEGLGEHGEDSHGFFLHRSTLRVPLLLRAPGKAEPRRRVAHPLSLADVAPTLFEAAGLASPVPLDGRSLLPAAGGRGDGGATPSPQYAETLYGWRAYRWAQSVAIRDGQRRLIDFEGGRREAFDPAADPGETKDLGKGPAAPGDDGAAARAWELFRSPPLSPPLPDSGVGGEPLPGYISGYSPLRILPVADNASLPLPSASFHRRMETALRLIQRASAEATSAGSLELLRQAREVLGELDRQEPANPAVAFWMGRAFKQEGRLSQEGVVNPWKDAFKWFQEAGRRGYREPRTVSLMLEACYHAREYRDMLAAARLAVEEGRMDGDASFWTWVALAWWEGAREGDRVPTTEGKSRAHAYLERALRLARSEAEKARISEVKGSIQ